MKSIVTGYTFNPATRQIVFTDLTTLDLKRLVVIVNQKSETVIFAIAMAGKGATAVGNVLTLEFDTTAMNAGDSLTIHYMPDSDDDGRPKIAGYNDIQKNITVGNITDRFRDGFDGTTQPDPATWDVVNPDSQVINAGGNAAGASYLRISMSPFLVASEVLITSKQTFRMPFRIGYGLSMSQRVLGQEVLVGFEGVDQNKNIESTTPIADIALTGTAVLLTNVATFTVPNHGLVGGQRVTILGCAEPRLNVGPVFVTIVDENSFTVPCTLANATYSVTGGTLRFADPFRFASNAGGVIFDGVTPTSLMFLTRRSGGSFRNLVVNANPFGTTTALQSNASPYSDAFNAASNFELSTSLEELGFRAFNSDGLATAVGAKYTQGVPDEDKEYKLVIRSRTLSNFTTPVARITAIAKTGTTTATVTTDVPHGLTALSWVQIYGVLDQVNFPNLIAATLVASIVDATHFTVVIGTATTNASAGGTVFANQGSALAPGVFTSAIQSIVRVNNVITVTGNVAWATPLAGEMLQIHGMQGAAAQYDGAYKVLKFTTTSMDLLAPGADFTVITTGGAVMRRTDVRLHFARLLDFTRMVVEVSGGRGNTTDVNNAVPTAIVNAPAVTQSTGLGTTLWSAAGYGGFLVADVISAAVTATVTGAAVIPGGLANFGVYAHSFNVVATVVTGAGAIMDVAVEESPDNGINWVRIYEFERISATGFYTSPLIRAQFGTRYRYVQTIAGTTPSFTRAINRVEFSSNAPLIRSFIDRSIVPTTLNSTTPTTGSFIGGYNVDGCNNFQFSVSMGAEGTPSQYVMEGSEDRVTWYLISTAPLVAVPNSTVTQSLPQGAWTPKFVRVRVSTAGVGSTLGYVSVKGQGA